MLTASPLSVANTATFWPWPLSRFLRWRKAGHKEWRSEGVKKLQDYTSAQCLSVFQNCCIFNAWDWHYLALHRWLTGFIHFRSPWQTLKSYWLMSLLNF